MVCLRFRSPRPANSRVILSVLAVLCLISCPLRRTLADENSELNALLAPSSPAFILFGREPATIERPATVADLKLSVLNRFGSGGGFPEDFAVEASPYWLSEARHLTYEEYAEGGRLIDNIVRTATISIAGSNRADSAISFLAAGLRFSILQGEIDEAFGEYAALLDSLGQTLGSLGGRFAGEWQKQVADDPLIRELYRAYEAADSSARRQIEIQISQRQEDIKRQIEGELRENYSGEIARVREIISNLRLRRLGWKLDFSGGLSARFPGRAFDSGKVDRWGAWLTGGYEKRNWHALGMARYLAASEGTHLSSLDLGGRLGLETARATLSGEAAFRANTGTSSDSDSWRYAVILDYEFSRNKVVSLTLGRDFNGRRAGSLLALLGFLFGFGLDRPVG